MTGGRSPVEPEAWGCAWRAGAGDAERMPEKALCAAAAIEGGRSDGGGNICRRGNGPAARLRRPQSPAAPRRLNPRRRRGASGRAASPSACAWAAGRDDASRNVGPAAAPGPVGPCADADADWAPAGTREGRPPRCERLRARSGNSPPARPRRDPAAGLTPDRRVVAPWPGGSRTASERHPGHPDPDAAAMAASEPCLPASRAGRRAGSRRYRRGASWATNQAGRYPSIGRPGVDREPPLEVGPGLRQLAVRHPARRSGVVGETCLQRRGRGEREHVGTPAGAPRAPTQRRQAGKRVGGDGE